MSTTVSLKSPLFFCVTIIYVDNFDHHSPDHNPVAIYWSNGEIEVLNSLRKKPLSLFVVLYHEFQHHLINSLGLPFIFHSYLEWVKNRTVRKVIP